MVDGKKESNWVERIVGTYWCLCVCLFCLFVSMGNAPSRRQWQTWTCFVFSV